MTEKEIDTEVALDAEEESQIDNAESDSQDEGHQGLESGSEKSRETNSSNEDKGVHVDKKHPHLIRNIAIAVIAVIVVIVAAVGYNFSTGALSPASAAVKYDGNNYIDESEVTDYIMTYKTQMGFGDASDDDWAQFLATYNLSPEKLRLSTINELLSERMIEKKCAELGITVTDAEIDEEYNSYRDSYAFGDDSVFKSTLEQYGQTVEGFRNVLRLNLLESKLCEREVTVGEPTTDQIAIIFQTYSSYRKANDETYLEETAKGNTMSADDMTGCTLKHSYCFYYPKDSSSSLTSIEACDDLRKQFVASGATVDNFNKLVSEHAASDKKAASEVGWDVDSSEYSDNYQKALKETELGGTSSVFEEGDYVCFIYVDQTYFVPYGETELNAVDVTAMPSSLYQVFSDSVKEQLFESACSDYISNLVSSIDVTVYEMPSDVPYNVDMSAYEVASTSNANATSSASNSSSGTNSANSSANNAATTKN